MSKLIKSVAAVLAVLGLAYGAAQALSVDQSKTPVQRRFTEQQTHFYRWTMNYNDPAITTGQQFAAMARGTFIDSIKCHVTQAFNGTTPQMSIGTALGGAQILAATGAGASIDLTSATYQSATSAAGLGLAATNTADVIVYTKFISAGGSPSAGSVTCVMNFTPPMDM
jgi:hypothetical protein